MKRYILLFAAFLTVVLAFSGCNDIKQIKVTSFEVVSITPKGFNGIDALVKVGFHNPAMAFELADAVGTAKVKGVPCLEIGADRFVVDGKCDKTYSIHVHGELAQGFDPFQLLQLLNNQMGADDLTLDVSAKAVLRGGIGKKIDLKDIPLSKFMKK